MGDSEDRLALLELQDRLAALKEENRRLKGALRARERRPSGRKIRPGAHNGEGRIFGYVRPSSDRQEDSVPMQKELIRKKAEQMGGRLVQTWVDDGVSAADVRWSERRGFTGLMADLQPGDHLILWRLDRLDCSPLGVVAALEWLFDRGVSVHVLEYGGLQVDLDAQSGRLLTTILAEFTNLLVNYRRDTVRQSICWRRERGLAAGAVEMGKRRVYQMVADPQRPGKMRRQGFDEWDAKDCDVIREIWRRHQLQHESLYSIARDLMERGFKRADGRPWMSRGCRRRPGIKPYPLNSRTLQRAFWRYTAMLAVGEDLQDLPANPEHVKIARARIHEHRLRWGRRKQPGRVPQEVRNLLEQNNLDALPQVTPKTWQKRLYAGPGQ